MLKPVLNFALLIALILFLVVATVLFGGILPEYNIALYALAGLMTLLWAGKLILCCPVSAMWSPVHVPVILFTGYAVLRYAVSPIEYESRTELLHIGLCALVYFLVACNFYRMRDRLSVTGALVCLAVGESIYALWQYKFGADVVLWLERGSYFGRGSGTYFCPNHLAGLLEMALVILVAQFLIKRETNRTLQSVLLWKLYSAAAVVVIGLGLFSTLSRGGWAAAAVALVVLLVLAEFARTVSSRLVIAIFASLVLIGALGWNVPQVRERIEQNVHFQLDYVPGDGPVRVVAGLSGRYPMWRATMQIIHDHRWLGTGPGTWQWFHLRYREPMFQLHPQFAHNDVLQLTSDYGVIGAGLVAAIFVCFFWQALRILRRSESFPQRIFTTGTCAAVTAMIVHSLGDFNFHIPANALWIATLMGLTVAQRTEEESRSRRELGTTGKWALGILVFISGAGIAWAGFHQAQSARFTSLGYDSDQRFEWSQAIQHYQRAVRFDPGNPETRAQIGDAYRMQSALADSQDDLAERRRLALMSVAAYRQSLLLNPFQSEVMLRLAAAYELASDTAGAARTYAEAVTIDPNNAFNWLRVGMFYRRIGDTGRAIEALQYSQRLNNLEPIADKYLKEIAAEQTAKP